MAKIPKLPKFAGKKRGPLTSDEHKECVPQFGSSYDRILAVLGTESHMVSCRLQTDRSGKPAPCGYVFYNQKTFDDEQRGRMYIVQNMKNRENFEIVFRMWKKQLPFPKEIWDNELGDDRYEVCKASIKNRLWQWKAFVVKTKEDENRAIELVQLAKTKYDEIFSDALRPYRK